MTARWIAAVSLWMAAACGCFGQDHPNFPWWNSPVTQDIGLSNGQTQRIRQIVRSYRDRLLDARNDVLKARGDLSDYMNSSQVRLEEAEPMINRLASAQANSSRVFMEMSMQLRSVLTLDQWRQLVRRWDEMKKRKRSDTQTLP